MMRYRMAKRRFLPAVLAFVVIGLTAPAAAAYSPSQAAQYADTWATSRNPNFKTFTDDCTNFVSQALNAGGFAMVGSGGSTTSYTNWFMQNLGFGLWNWSHTWSVVPDQLNFLYYHSPGGYARGYVTPQYQSGLRSGGAVGDVLFYDWGSRQGVSHSAIQVSYGTDPVSGWTGDLVDTHITDHFHAFWSLKPYNANLAATTYITVVNVSTSN